MIDVTSKFKNLFKFLQVRQIKADSWINNFLFFFVDKNKTDNYWFLKDCELVASDQDKKLLT